MVHFVVCGYLVKSCSMGILVTRELKISDGCPEGWMAFGARCFYFSHLHQEHPQTWFEAAQMCKNLGQGSTLASIRTQEEQDFVASNTTFFNS